MAWKKLFAFVLSTLILVGMASEVTALEACGASSDGKWVATGGVNRTLYVVNVEKAEVVQRVWLGCRIKKVHFTRDDKQCLVYGDDKKVYVYQTSDWKLVQTKNKMSHFSMSSQANLAVTQSGLWNDIKIAVWSLPDWKKVTEVSLGKKVRPAALAVSNDGKWAYVRTQSEKDDAEKKADVGSQPKDWKKRSVWRARKDGRVSTLMVISLADGKVTKSYKTFDTVSNNSHLYPVAKGLLTIKYGGYSTLYNLQTDEYKVIFTKEYAYGSGPGVKGKFFTGSLASYLVMTDEGKILGKYRLKNRLPGFPEYFRGFCPLGENLVAGATDSFRVVIFDGRSHKVVKIINVY